MSTDIELENCVEQRTGSFCAPDYYNELLAAFERKHLNRFEEILKKDSVDVNRWYGDPYYGTLLDLGCRSANNCHFVEILLRYGAAPNCINKIRKKAPLHFAVEYADLNTVKQLLEDPDIDVNIVDSTGSTALHIAARLNSVDVVELLLQRPHLDINRVNRKGQTALHVAIQEDSRETVQLLLKRLDVDLDRIKSISGHTARQLIAEKYPDLQKQMELREVPLDSSSGNDDIKSLFACLYDRNTRSFLQRVTLSKCTVNAHDGSHTYLQYACSYGLSDVAQYLLDIGVNPNECSPTNNKPPIMIAAYNGFINIVRSLVGNSATSFQPVNGETVLHAVINGMSFQRDREILGCEPNEERNYHEVLKCLLSHNDRGNIHIDINTKDLKGNTALHYAGKLGDPEAILLLLRYGAYVGEQNILGEQALSNIPAPIFKLYLDECITSNDRLPREDNYEVIFNYNFLVPPKQTVPVYYSGSGKRKSIAESGAGNFEELPHSKCETAPLLFMTDALEMQPLLKHPVLMSFVNLKWYTIRKYFYVNLSFYTLFWLLLTVHVLIVYGGHRAGADSSAANSSDISAPVYQKEGGGGAGAENRPKGLTLQDGIWSVTLFLTFILAFRELFQFIVSPVRYISSFENWLEVGLIVTSLSILCYQPNSEKYQMISAVVILLSWTELVLLIGRHPLLSTNIEMFKTVCHNFLKFLAWYSILILAFALSFYLMFKDETLPDDEVNFFRDPAISIFKSVVMTTGEFDAGSIPFQKHPGTSHLLFILFVFLIAIVLFNLLNGLAVSDTQSIRANAELVSYVSRIKLISYFESMMCGKNMPSRNSVYHTLRCCCCLSSKRHRSSFKRKQSPFYYGRLNLFQNVLPEKRVRVLPNQECRVVLTDAADRQSDDVALNCIDDCAAWYIDPTTVKLAQEVISCRNKKAINESLGAEHATLIEDYRNQLENYKAQLEMSRNESEEMKRMLREILSMLRQR